MHHGDVSPEIAQGLLARQRQRCRRAALSRLQITLAIICQYQYNVIEIK